MTTSVDLLVAKAAPVKNDLNVNVNGVSEALCQSILSIAHESIATKGSFTIALSGGSLPSFLAALPAAAAAAAAATAAAGGDANPPPPPSPSWWSRWHVFLADERCVPLSSRDSNLKSLQEQFLHRTSIPESQIYGINQQIRAAGDDVNTIQAIAQDYQATMERVLQELAPPSSSSPHALLCLDLAVLGFGPDGHTCSLFPNHPLLAEDTKWVAAVTDSPKPPSNRITLTFPFLNSHTHHVIVCGTGVSKRPIVQHVFSPHTIFPLHSRQFQRGLGIASYSATIANAPPPPFPCAMVHPLKSLTWILDTDAVPRNFGLLSHAVAEVAVLPTPAEVGRELCREIVDISQQSIRDRGVFSIALSGGKSLPASLLSQLPQAFRDRNIANPQYEKWHVVLADERGVPDDHRDSNLHAIRRSLLNQNGVSIPPKQVYGIDNVSLSESIQATAINYQTKVRSLLDRCNGFLDLVVLGVGDDDGHTCSLFPHHPVLLERDAYVAAMTDAPQSPSHRITFTFRTLNEHSRHVVFCATGDAKSPILHEILQGAYPVVSTTTSTTTSTTSSGSSTDLSRLEAHVYPKYPCGMVRPKERLVYIVDKAAMKEVFVALSEEAADKDQETNTGARLIARRGSSLLPKPATAKLYVRSTQKAVAEELCAQIVRLASMAIAERNAFTVAFSGGSLAYLLSNLPQAFVDAGVDPHYHLWHVLLADERCVPEDHIDSNFHALHQYLLQGLYEQILHQHIYSLDQVSIGESPAVAAQDYERKVHTALAASGGMLDLAVLGFGPDGHTASLFPGHCLLQEQKRWVAAITDSPKPPLNRVTLTLPLLNDHTRNVLFCGMGESKSGILRDIFCSIKAKGLHFETDLKPVYPCSMIRPQEELVYLVDDSAMGQIASLPSSSAAAAAAAAAVQYAKVLVAKNKGDIPHRLLPLLVQQAQRAIRDRGIFVIALSGGSLPELLSRLGDTYRHLSVHPQWDKWHILLADERCVPKSDPDSNLGSIQSHLLDFVEIPPSQVYGIDESKLNESTTVQAQDYESTVRTVLAKSGGMLDVALLGFGPDGHTCSLFPGHEKTLQERTRWVAGIDDSPKPPPKRITLTLGLLNEWTRTIIFCGAGKSKEPVLNQVFQRLEGRQVGADAYVKIQTEPPPFPCAMVLPQTHLFWVVDEEAMPKRLQTITPQHGAL